MHTNNTVISTLRVHGAQQNKQQLQLALSSLLDSADLQPTAIPPSAVLIVRRLADPMPGQVAPSRRAGYVNATWERAVQDALADCYRRASRPSRGAVPADAAAVVFADEGELLACLALDIVRHRAHERWWWRALLRNAPSSTSDGLTHVLVERATAVPAALHYLAQRGQAVTVVSVLAPQQARRVLAAVNHAYGLADVGLEQPLSGLISAGDTHEETAPQTMTQTPSSLPGPSATDMQATARPISPPWSTMIVPATLGKEQATLLGVGLSLHQKPAAVRSRHFQRQLQVWWAQPAMNPTSPAQSPSVTGSPVPADRLQSDPSGQIREETVTPPTPDQKNQEVTERVSNERRAETRTDHLDAVQVQKADAGSEPAEDAQGRSGAALPDALTPVEDGPAAATDGAVQVVDSIDRVGTPSEQEGADQITLQDTQTRQTDAASADFMVSGQLEGTLSSTQTDLPQPASEQPLSATPERTDSVDSQPSSPVDDVMLDTATAAEENVGLHLAGGVSTRLAGVFYLINLMLQLDLPAAFEDDWTLGSQVGAWGVLELLGRALLATDRAMSAKQQAALTDDPRWTALAHLDGRATGTLPGTDFMGVERFHLPAEWLVPDDEQPGYCWAVRQDQLVVWSTAGYLLVACPLSDHAPQEQADQELREHFGITQPGLCQRAAFDQAPLVDLAAARWLHGLSPDLARWLTLVLPYIRWRLQQILGLAADEAGTLVDVLLRHPGTLYVTATHVDLVLGLDDIWVELRMAGLDWNPGWVPEFGRVVMFHFE